MATFRYDPAVIERFPDIHAGVVFASGLSNGPSAAALTTSYQAVQTEVRARIEGLAIAEHPSIHTWRRTLSAFGVKPTQHRVAAEALMRRLSKVGDIPSINTLVDIGNLVSIRYAMPVAAMDLAASPGGFTVTFAEGTEPFTDLGADEPTQPDAGEVVFVGDDRTVHARRWCWRQSAQSATSADTTQVMFVVEALHDAAPVDVARALDDLRDILAEHQPQAALTTYLLNAATPSTD